MTPSESTSDRELVLTRILKAPRTSIYRAWTEPALIKQWFAPKPYETPIAELDVQPGGSNLIVMRGPDGAEFPNRGRLPRSHPQRAHRLHRRVYLGLGAFWKTIHDRYHHPRRRRRARQNTRPSPSLDHPRSRSARKDGFPSRLGPMRRAVGSCRRQPLGMFVPS